MPRIAGKVIEGEEWAIHTRRRNLQAILTWDGILHIEHTTDLTADIGTMVHAHAICMINVDHQTGMLTLGQVFDTPELKTHRGDYRLDQRVQRSILECHRESSYSRCIRHLAGSV